jgi:hypothetical protein
MKYKFITCTLLFVSFLVYSLQSTDKNLKKHLVKAINHNYAYVASDSLVSHDFIIFKTEVSNLNYREFLLDLKQRGEVEKWKLANIDSTRWATTKLDKCSLYRTLPQTSGLQQLSGCQCF